MTLSDKIITSYDHVGNSEAHLSPKDVREAVKELKEDAFSSKEVENFTNNVSSKKRWVCVDDLNEKFGDLLT